MNVRNPKPFMDIFFRSSCVTEPKGRIHLLSSRWLQKKNMKLIFLFDAHSLRLSVRTLANTRTFEHTLLRFARTPTFDERTHASHANTN